jgi:hypothetical protein
MTTDALPPNPTPADEKAPIDGPLAKGPIVARPGQYYRMTRYLMTLILVGYGIWSIHDGFFSWPKWAITHPNEKPKTETDIKFNKVLGVLLPPLGLFVLIRALRSSRGQYRLEDEILHVPGHPPIPLDRIQSVDKQLWDRKGIAFIEYDVAGSPTGTVKLDDFVYDRGPTDQIFAEIETALVKTTTKPKKPLVAAVPRVKTPPRPKLGPYG